MKSFAILAAVAAIGIMSVAAQNYPANMPQCGHVCGDNLLGMNTQFNCSSSSDYACLCRAKNFGYGVHDCAVQACQNADSANIVIGWGNTLCNDAGVPINLPSAGSSAGGSGIAASGSGPTVTTSGEVVATASGSLSAISTSSFTSVITSGGSTITSTGATTLFTTISGSASSTNGASGAGGTSSTTAGAGAHTSSSASASSASSHATSSTSAAGAMQTAAPVVGLLAAAGFAAALL